MCDKCQGLGKIIRPEIAGQELRDRRKRAGFSLRNLADQMSISAPFLSDCELGRRNMSEKNRQLFDEIVGNRNA